MQRNRKMWTSLMRKDNQWRVTMTQPWYWIHMAKIWILSPTGSSNFSSGLISSAGHRMPWECMVLEVSLWFGQSLDKTWDSPTLALCFLIQQFDYTELCLLFSISERLYSSLKTFKLTWHCCSTIVWITKISTDIPLLWWHSKAAWAVIYKNDMRYKNDRFTLKNQRPEIIKILSVVMLLFI